MKRGLGNRGLKVLLSEQQSTAVDASSSLMMTLDQLRSGKFQPRRHWDESALAELASSIKAQGVIQPLVVRKEVGVDGYEIVAGERRWRAAKLAGLDRVPIVVKELDDKATLAIALIENIQRQDLSVIEEALAMKRLIDEFSLSHEELAKSLGKSRTVVTNNLRLLQLEPSVQQRLQEGELSMGHARALVPLSGQQQILLTHKINAQQWTVRQTEKAAQLLLDSKSSYSTSDKPPKKVSYSVYASEVSANIENATHLKASCRINSSGKGEVKFVLNSLDDLERLLNKLNVKTDG